MSTEPESQPPQPPQPQPPLSSLNEVKDLIVQGSAPDSLSAPFPAKFCGAKLVGTGPDGRVQRCVRPAGWLTNHIGSGRCADHEELPSRPPARRYSNVRRPRVVQLLQEYENDPDPLNLLPELAMLRAMTVDYLERYDEMAEAIIAWHASYSEEYQAAMRSYNQRRQNDPDFREFIPNPVGYGKPKQIADVASVSVMIGQIGQLAERIQKQRDNTAVTLADVDRFWKELSYELFHAVEEVIQDESTRTELLGAVEKRWQTVRIGEPGPTR